MPPIEATIGIKIANATTFSIFSSKKPITKEAITAVIKFNVNQINLFFVISIAIGSRVDYEFNYINFLAPGLIIMTMMQSQ